MKKKHEAFSVERISIHTGGDEDGYLEAEIFAGERMSLRIGASNGDTELGTEMRCFAHEDRVDEDSPNHPVPQVYVEEIPVSLARRLRDFLVRAIPVEEQKK